MKREEIIAKWAGMTARERDAWVARAVMGWRRVSRPGGGGGYVGWHDADGCLAAIETDYSMSTDSRDWFRPTQDISAAWEVLNVFWSVIVERHGGSDIYTVIIRDDEGDLQARASSESLPEAACLAAIIARLTEDSADVAV